MPRPAAALAALILAAGSAAAETRPKPAASAATPPPEAAAAGIPAMVPGLAIVSLERIITGTGTDVVAMVSNSSANTVPKGSHAIRLKCANPITASRGVTRVLDAVAAHGRLEITLFKNEQHPVPPPETFAPDIGGLTSLEISPPGWQPRLVFGPPWSCTASLVAARGHLANGAAKSISWGVEFDYGISDIAFEKAATAPPTVNVRVKVLSKKVPTASWQADVISDLRTLRLACSKPGGFAKSAEAPAAASVLFGTAGAGFLPAPATGWTCRASLFGPGSDADPSNDAWALTAP